MKTLDIAKATASLAQYAREVGDEPIVLTDAGRPVAALVSVEEADLESLALSTHPEFLDLIERSRARYRAEGGISSAEMRRRLGLQEAAEGTQ